MSININLLKKLRSRKSILICGLPGIAYIGKLSVDYLIRELQADLIGEVYSSYFSPYVLIGKNGIVELLRNELHFTEKKSDKGIFFFTGNTQADSPEGQYYIVDKILDTSIDLGVERVYSIAAFLTDRSFENPSVYGTTTDLNLLKEIEEYGVKPMKQGSISGMNGLIFGLAKIKGLEGICLLGETRGFQTTTGHYLVDAKATRAVLEVLTKMMGFEVDMEPLDKQTQQMEEFIIQLENIEKRVREEMRRASESGRTRYIT
jgi:uncharacterized protein (TIGR00162 family)